METFFSGFEQVIAGVIVLAAVIFFHELGHFLMARALKIGVVTFSIGFGTKIIKFTRNRTEYCLSLIPLGGYCAVVGEYDSEVETRGFTQEESVTHRPPLHRLLLALAGPLANFIFAFFIYFGIAWHSGASTVLPIIGDAMPQSAAAEAGLKKGDLILSIAGHEIKEWNTITEVIALTKGETINLEYIPAGTNDIIEILFTPKESIRTNLFGEEEYAYLLGVTPLGTVSQSPLSFTGALVNAWDQVCFMIETTLVGLKKLITGSVAADNLGGPIFIAQVLGEQASVGIIPLLLFAALISVNLGLLNLLPIPVLDGGTIVFSIIEIITRRPINEKLQTRLMQIGAALLIALMIFATFNDLMRFFR